MSDLKIEITKVETRPSYEGRWVSGTLGHFAFNALIFPHHAEVGEIDRSFIRKLWLYDESDTSHKRPVALFYHVWEEVPETDEAKAALEFIKKNLYGMMGF